MSELNLLAQYTPLVHRMVGGFLRKLPHNVLREDLIAAGMAGLWDATQKHSGEPEKFEWYAKIRIRGAILDELRTQDWLSRRARWLMASSEDFDVRFVALEEIQQEPSVTPDLEAFENGTLQRQRALKEAIAQLPEREKLIVTLCDLQGKKLKDVARILEVSEPRISQLRSRAHEHLRELMGA